MKRTIICTLISLGWAASASAGATGPTPGPYTFTGVATVVKGGSVCLAGSPAAITGDGIVSQGGSLGLHIKASPATDGQAFFAQLKRSVNSPVVYGKTGVGPMGYLLLPSPTPLMGTYRASAAPGASGELFTETVKLYTTPLAGAGTTACVINVTASMTPGINPALLELFQNVF